MLGGGSQQNYFDKLSVKTKQEGSEAILVPFICEENGWSFFDQLTSKSSNLRWGDEV